MEQSCRLVRRVIQYAYIKMGKPPEYNQVGQNKWKDREGRPGLIEQIQNYVGVSGWRSVKLIRQIVHRCQTDKNFDADKREVMCKPRKRKMRQKDVNLAGKMLRYGAGTQWAATFVNHQIRHDGGDDKNKIHM